MRTVVQKLARLALKDDAFAILDNGVKAGDRRKRTGSLHGIGVSCDAFTHVFSVRQTRCDRINRLEVEALLLMLRWVLRSPMWHASRVVILFQGKIIVKAQRFCVGQLLSICSVTLWCVGFWCHRQRIQATFCQEDARVSQYRRRLHWLTTKGSVPVSSIDVTNTCLFHSSSLLAWNDKIGGCALFPLCFPQSTGPFGADHLLCIAVSWCPSSSRRRSLRSAQISSRFPRLLSVTVVCCLKLSLLSTPLVAHLVLPNLHDLKFYLWPISRRWVCSHF